MNLGSLTRRGEKAPNARFTMQQAREFRRRYRETGESIARLAAEARCGYSTMQRVVTGQTYREANGL